MSRRASCQARSPADRASPGHAALLPRPACRRIACVPPLGPPPPLGGEAGHAHGALADRGGCCRAQDGSLISRHTGVGEIFEVSWSARGDKVAASFSNATLAVLDFRMLK